MARILNFENAKIGFRNLEGREGQFNKEGHRSFVVFLDEREAIELEKEGWNIKFPKPNDKIDKEDDDRRPYMAISVAFDYYPAKVVLISNDQPTVLQETEVGMLDWAELESVDLVVRPYEWSVNGKSGIKAYLKAGYFTIVSDKFSDKYGI